MQIIENYNQISNYYLIDSGKEGPEVSIFAGVHGDEFPGVNALIKFVKECQQGKHKLLIGRLHLITIANEQAFEQKIGEIKHNLNRLFQAEYLNRKTEEYEIKRAQELSIILKKVNYHLDLHTTSAQSVPFAFVEEKVLELASKLKIPFVVEGWSRMDEVVQGDIEIFVNKSGGQGITFEAGSYLENQEQAEQYSYQMILNYLSVLRLLDKSYFKNLSLESKILSLQSNYVVKTDDFKYLIPEVASFKFFEKGTAIAQDGEKIITFAEDAWLIMPTKQEKIKVGEEAYFVGIEK